MRTVKLYKGTVTLEFQENPYHRFYANGKPTLSVTAGTGMIDKSGPLMYWAVNMAIEKITELWDHRKEYSIADKMDIIEKGKKAHRVFVKKAGEIGEQAHKWAEAYVKGEDPQMPKDPKVLNAVTAFLKWVKGTNVKFIKTEAMVYSKKHKYAGLLDLEAKIDGQYAIVDYKTSKGVYNEMRYQRAAYQAAREEESGRKYGDGYIIRFGKEDGEFEAVRIPAKDQKKDFKAFLSALNLKVREKELK